MSHALKPFSRVTCLDGLRGVAAFIVIISHLVAGFFPALYFGAEGKMDVALQDAIAKSPLFVFYSGTFAVYVFFVLSGFVIAASASKTTCKLPLLVVTRYLRLAIPVVVSVSCAFLLGSLFSGAPQRAASIVGHWWLGFMYQALSVSYLTALREGFFSVFWTGLSYYNNVLWTMRVELAGSVGIYALYMVVDKTLRVQSLILVSLLLCFVIREWPSNMLGFCLGALIYEACARGRMVRNNPAGAVLVLFGLFLGGLPFAPAMGTVYESLSAFVDQFSPVFSTLRTMGAAALLLGILMWEKSRTVLDARLPQFLGRISFALYLVHFPILCFGLSELYVWFGQFGALSMAVAILCYVVVSILVAYAFTVLVDEPAVRFLVGLRRSWNARPVVLSNQQQPVNARES